MDFADFVASFFMLFVFAAVLGPAAFSVYATLRWPIPWKYFAALPIAVLLAWILWLVISLSIDPTSHNLWPFELLMGSVAAWPYVVLLYIVKKLRDRNSPDPGVNA